MYSLEVGLPVDLVCSDLCGLGCDDVGRDGSVHCPSDIHLDFLYFRTLKLNTISNRDVLHLSVERPLYMTHTAASVLIQLTLAPLEKRLETWKTQLKKRSTEYYSRSLCKNYGVLLINTIQMI